MKKNSLALVVALVITLGSGFSLFAARDYRAYLTRGWSDAATSDEALPLRVSHAGANVDLAQYSPEQLTANLDALAALGATWVRQEFDWAEIERAQGEFDWQQTDTLVAAVEAASGLRLVAVLLGTPAWASLDGAPNPTTAPPARAEDFARFAGAFAARYGPIIDTYQIWDEPNLSAAWGGLPPNPSEYVALLQGAYDAIHAADATATVITAGLAPTLETGPRNYSDPLFLQMMYDSGGGSAFDAVAGKPYGFTSGPDDRTVAPETLNFSRLILLREELVRHGDAEKAVWGTQFGWNALPTDWTGEPSLWGTWSRAQQLAFIQTAYERVEREWPWLGGLIVEHWQPDVPQDDPRWGFALVRPGEDPASLPADLFGTPGIATAGRYHALTAFASYTGDWEFGPIGADIQADQGSKVTFRFQGADLGLEVRRANYRGYLFVTVDGAPANALPQDDLGRSYVILTAADLQPGRDVITVARGLGPGSHTLQIEGSMGLGQWALTAYRVGVSADELPSLNALEGVSGILGLLGLLATLFFASRTLPGWLARSSRASQGLGYVRQVVLGGLVSVVLMLGMYLTWQHGTPTLLRREPPALLLGLLTAGLIYVSPSLLITILAAVFLWFLIFQNLEVGLHLTLIWVPFFMLPFELYQYAFALGEVLVLLTFTAWLLHQVIAWAKRYRESAGAIYLPDWHALLARLSVLDWAMLVFFALATLTLFWADYRTEALREWRTVFLEPGLFYLMVRTTLRSRDELVRLVDILIVAAIVVSIASMAFFFAGERVIYAEGGTPRMAGIYGSPNNVGLFMERVLPFAVVFLLTASNPRRRWLALIATGIMLFAVLLSQSVATIALGIPAALGVVLLLWRFRRGLLAVIATGVVGLLAFIPLSRTSRFANLLNFSSGTSFFRLRVWQSAWKMIEDHPIQGIGLDQFLHYYRGFYIRPEAWQEPSLSHPHNILLDFWLRLGLAGVLWLIWLQITFWRITWHLYRSLPRDSLAWAICIGTMGSMAGLLVHGLVDNSVFVLDLSYIFVLLIALPGQLSRLVDANS